MNHSMPEINTLLKQLRLSHMAEHLAERNRQAIEGKLTYLEFLALLVQDEMLYRDNKKLIVRLKRAGFQGEKTIENFNFDFNPKINRAYLQDLATCRFVAEKSPVLIVGPCGTGKSHIAMAIGHCAIRQGIDVLFTSQSRLFNTLQAAKATHCFDKKMAQLIKIPLLIIDDFGIKPLRTPQDEDFHDLIAERYENASTVVTSNLEFNEWGDAFPNRLLAAATLDRLRHDAYRIVLEGSSYRSSRELKSTKKIGGK